MDLASEKTSELWKYFSCCTKLTCNSYFPLTLKRLACPKKYLKLKYNFPFTFINSSYTENCRVSQKLINSEKLRILLPFIFVGNVFITNTVILQFTGMLSVLESSVQIVEQCIMATIILFKHIRLQTFALVITYNSRILKQLRIFGFSQPNLHDKPIFILFICLVIRSIICK